MFDGALEIIEVGPRDGLQDERMIVSTAAKVALIHRCIDAGARRIEAVSFVNPATVPQMADAEAVMAMLSDRIDRAASGVRIAGLILNRRGLDRALCAGVDEVNFVIIASQTFSRRNQGGSIADVQARLEDVARACTAQSLPLTVTIGAAFGCPFEGETPTAVVDAIAAHAVACGAAEIALADTIGAADPCAVRARFDSVRAIAPDTPMRGHFHNTRNTGMANAYAAWLSGVTGLDASTGGIGGCPFAPGASGNIATEDLVYMFERMGITTGFSLGKLLETGTWLRDRLSHDMRSGLAGAGLFPRNPTETR